MKQFGLLYRLLYAAILIGMLTGCGGSKALLADLRTRQVTIVGDDLTENSALLKSRHAITMGITEYTNTALTPNTEIIKKSFFVLPLLLFNGYFQSYTVQLGQLNLKQSYPDFFLETFYEESERMGNYNLAEYVDSCDYTIEITCDTCDVVSVFDRNWMVMILPATVSWYTFYENGSRPRIMLTANLVVKQDDVVVFSRRYIINRKQDKYDRLDNEQAVFLGARDYRDAFLLNMSSLLGNSTRACVQSMVSDISAFLVQRQSDRLEKISTDLDM